VKRLVFMASSFKRRSQDVSGISVARRNLNGPKQKHLFAGAEGLVIENRRLMCYKSPWGRGREKRRPSTLAGGHGDGSPVLALTSFFDFDAVVGSWGVPRTRRAARGVAHPQCADAGRHRRRGHVRGPRALRRSTDPHRLVCGSRAAAQLSRTRRVSPSACLTNSRLTN
jgi:hypothetical protein